MKKIITAPKIIAAITLGFVFIVTGIILGFQNKPLVQTVEAVGQQYDLLDYYLPNSDYVIHMNNGEKFHTFTGVINSRSGFTTLKSAEGKWYEEYTYDNDKIYLNRDTTWATGFNQNVKCTNPNTQNDAAFVWLLGHYEKDEARSLVGSDKEGGVWINRRMSVGDTTDRGQITVAGFDKTICQPCDTQYVGKTGGTVKLVEVFSIWKGGADGKEFNDVAHIWVTGGTGSGEHFYLAKGIGRVGWSNGGSTSYAKVVENGRINKVELCSGNQPQPTPTPGGPQPTPTPTPEVCEFERPSLFGANAEGGVEAFDKMVAAGFKSVRIAINWDVVERSQNNYTWDEFDFNLNRFNDAGFEIVALIIGTPDWAAPNDSRPPHRRMPSASFQSEYEEFLRLASQRYPFVKKYEFWNEQNACGSNAGSGCRYDYDSYREYAYWLGVTYSTLKGVNTANMIAIGGLDGASDDQAVNPVQFVKDLATSSGGRSYDAIAHHPYNWTGEIRFDQIEALHDFAPNKEIWITEYGWNVNHTGEARQASYLESSLTKLTDPKYSYVTVGIFHTFGDFSTDPRMGLMEGYDSNGTQLLRPREAYNVFTRVMAGAKCGNESDTTLPPVIEGWLHPGIDIEPIRADALSNNIFATHAGFVTYAGPPPPSVKEKGWLVQIEADLNRDNVPDIITRYTHLLPGSTILVNDVRYKRRAFTPECFMDLQSCFDEIGISTGPLEKLPYGYGPYVARNQLIGMIGDSGSPGRVHVQYEIITNRYTSLYGSDLATYDCRDNPYLDVCITDYARPGFFFSINRQRPDEVSGPVYTNPGFVTPPPVPTAAPTPTPGPTTCLNEVVAHVDNTNLMPEHQERINKWLHNPWNFESTIVTGVIHFRDPFTFGQTPEFILNICQPGWEDGYKSLPDNGAFRLNVKVVQDDGGVENESFFFDVNRDPYKDRYIKDIYYSFEIPKRATYEIANVERGQSHAESMGMRSPVTDPCMETYVWGNARNEGNIGNLCGVQISCDLDRTNTNNPYCGPQSDCGGPEGWGNSGKYWAIEKGWHNLIHWRACQP